MDYAEIGEEGTEGAARKLLVGKDHDTGHHFSHLVKCKGLGDECIVDKVIESIKETGNTNIRLKTDGEPALVQVQERIAEKRGQATIPEDPPAYDPQSNGEAGRAVQEVKAQLRATKLGLEARLGATIRAEPPPPPPHPRMDDTSRRPHNRQVLGWKIRQNCLLPDTRTTLPLPSL